MHCTAFGLSWDAPLCMPTSSLPLNPVDLLQYAVNSCRHLLIAGFFEGDERIYTLLISFESLASTQDCNLSKERVLVY